FYWARRIPLQDADAADLVQEVFAILVRKLPEFEYDPQKGFRAWLRTITLNKWREKVRNRRGRSAQVNDSELDQIAAPADEISFWETEHRQILLRRCFDAVQSQFQPLTWQASWACLIEGRAIEEVARDLNLTA